MSNRNNNLKRLRQLIVFAMLAAFMFISKLILEFLPNVHLLGALTVTYTVVYRKKALIPIYLFVFLIGLYNGFDLWWIPYLYLWTVLWAMTMILPKKMSPKIAPIMYVLVCGLHGLAYGSLYAVFQAFAFNLNFEQTIAWIIAGFPWDITHCIGNILAGLLIYPLSKSLSKFEEKFN